MIKFINLIKKIFCRNELLTKQLQCDICVKLKSINGMQQIFGGICICYECISKILILHISSNPIKTLCPYCYDKEGYTEKCNYCDIKLLKKDKDDEN